MRDAILHPCSLFGRRLYPRIARQINGKLMPIELLIFQGRGIESNTDRLSLDYIELTLVCPIYF